MSESAERALQFNLAFGHKWSYYEGEFSAVGV
jgi:hypothetical protein